MLTKQQIEAIKPKEKLFKVSDGDMLYIFTSPTGKKVWKVLYTLDGKKGTITIGEYPLISIKAARLKRDEIKIMLTSGISPGQKKKEEKQKQLEGMSFRELIESYRDVVAPTYKGYIQEVASLNLFIQLFPKLMQKPVGQVGQLDMIEFRNERLKMVKAATVKRDLGLLGGVSNMHDRSFVSSQVHH